MGGIPAPKTFQLPTPFGASPVNNVSQVQPTAFVQGPQFANLNQTLSPQVQQPAPAKTSLVIKGAGYGGGNRFASGFFGNQGLFND